MGQPHHGAQELIDAFLGRKPAEVEQVAFIGGELFVVGQSLEVGQDFDASGGKTAVDQLVAHEFNELPTSTSTCSTMRRITSTARVCPPEMFHSLAR